MPAAIDRCAIHPVTGIPGGGLFTLDRYTGFQRENILDAELETYTGSGDYVLLCIRCATLITTSAAVCERHGSHVHAFSNPMGVRYVIGCFELAETTQRGEPTQEHTWFAGYAWEVALCPECHAHLGWRFTWPQCDDSFYGLINDHLRRAQRSEL